MLGTQGYFHPSIVFLTEALFVLFLQLLGYMIKCGSMDRLPSIAIVLSEMSAKVVLCPFQNINKVPVVDCILLDDYPLWLGDEGTSLNKELLMLLLLYCSSSYDIIAV